MLPTRCRGNHTCPLDVNTVVFSDGESVGEEVILHCRVSLDDVTPLATDVQVVYVTCLAIFLCDHASWEETDHVTPVLERTSKLSSVDG